MEEMENGKRYSAESKGYNDKIYEVRFLPVMERPEYQEGETREALEKLKKEMAEKDFEKYINNCFIHNSYPPQIQIVTLKKAEFHHHSFLLFPIAVL